MHAGRRSSLGVDERARYRRGWKEAVVTCRVLSSDVLLRSERRHKNSSPCPLGDIVGVGVVTESHSAPLLTMKHAFQTVGRKFGSAATGWTLQSSWCASVCVRLSEGRLSAHLPPPPLLPALAARQWLHGGRRCIFFFLQKKKNHIYVFSNPLNALCVCLCVRCCVLFSTLRPCLDQCLCVPAWE